MSFIDDITLGSYHPRDSFLHRLDPRIKLGILPLFVVASFAGGGFPRLAALAWAALFLLLLGNIALGVWWRGVWVFRWLFLCTLLLHLFLTPGRTLLGVAWLSQDGLVQGSQACCRLALAVTFSSLLTLTTPPSRVAAALFSLLAPLSRIGIPAQRISFLFRLVLEFIPILRDEARELVARCRYPAREGFFGRLGTRIDILREVVPLLLHRMVERADAMAKAYASGEIRFEQETLEPLGANRSNLTAAVAGFLFLLVTVFLLP
jgi:energy-coupling factor transport system permease protein